MRKGVFCTSFCNRGHRLSDGKPIKHACYVLPTEALHAEQRGDRTRSNEVFSAWKKRRPHKGVGS